MTDPLVSVIIPLYNRKSLIKETILSIATQSYHNIEIIVVDDGSTDGSQSIVNTLMNNSNKIRLLSRPANMKKGANTCRNYGLKMAKGDFIKWVDSDDLLNTRAIELQIKDIIASNTDLSICESIVFKLTDGSTEKIWLNNWGNLSNEISLINFCNYSFQWHTCSGLWRRNVFNNTLTWDEELNNSQEWLFHLTALSIGLRISVVKDALCYIRNHEGGMSDRSNKKSKYYYHECFARYKAAVLLAKLNKLNYLISRVFLRKVFRYHLFILYKKSFILFIKAFRFYPPVLLGLFRKIRAQ